jgi:hypothetical protein
MLLNGPGQGSRGGPDMWTGVSTAAIKFLANLHKGAEFTDPAQQIQTSRPIDGFVDDTTACTNRFTTELLMFAHEQHDEKKAYDLLKIIADDAQKLAQRWERLLWSTGGKLELTKCFTYVIHWVFDDKGKPTQATNTHLQEKLNIQPMAISNSSEGGQIQALEQKECFEAHKTLGAKIRADLGQLSEADRLTSKVVNFASDMRFARTSPSDANTFIRSIFNTSTSYSFPATSIPKKVLHKIQSPYVRVVMNKMHFPRNLSLPMQY